MVTREFGTMAGRVDEYEKLLRELSRRADVTDQALIRKALEKVVFAYLESYAGQLLTDIQGVDARR